MFRVPYFNRLHPIVDIFPVIPLFFLIRVRKL
ncbi:hypothetical protein [Bacillus thuringiensis]